MSYNQINSAEVISNSEISMSQLIEVIENYLPSYPYDHYKAYPAVNKSAWQRYFIHQFRRLIQDKENILLYDVVGELPLVLSAKISSWDEEHFGFKMATIQTLLGDDQLSNSQEMKEMLEEGLALLRSKGVKFVSIRINGDRTSLIHLLETNGFRYYETTIWPVASCENVSALSDPAVRFMKETDLATVLRIAAKNQYQRGHFHCDANFDRDKVNSMYAKWAKTAYENQDPIVVIEHEGAVVGYFVIKMNQELSSILGYQYGRMCSLCLDSQVRGKNLGQRLFQGAMSLMKQMGAEYLDSGYPTKNQTSAFIHTKNSFYSVYEEIALHAFISPIE